MKKKGNWLWRWTKRIFLGVLVLVLVLVVAGVVYQFVATKMDEGRYPPPGKMVDVGGFKMYISCVGEGSPTVVFDNGSGSASTVWNKTAPSVSAFTRTCTFDRAGIGWSETSPHGREFEQVNKELNSLLQNAGETGPFVLVGHSLGGIYIQNYVNRYPGDTAGVVLVDSTHPEQFTRGIDASNLKWTLRFVKIAAPIGVVRILTNLTASDNSPESMQANAVQNSTKHLYAVADELWATEASLKTLSEKPMQLDNKPLIVLSRSPNSPMPGIADPERMQQLWTVLQKELALRSTNSKHITAATAGHFIQTDEPELVITSVREIVEAIRKGEPLDN